MVAYFTDSCHDAFLNYIKNNGDVFVICQAQPTDYTDANTDPGSGGEKLGSKTGLTSGSYTGPQDRGSPAGRELAINTFTGGSVTYTGTATHWAILKSTATTELLVTHTLSASQSVTSGNTFSLSASFEVYVADPT